MFYQPILYSTDLFCISLMSASLAWCGSLHYIQMIIYLSMCFPIYFSMIPHLSTLFILQCIVTYRISPKINTLFFIVFRLVMAIISLYMYSSNHQPNYSIANKANIRFYLKYMDLGIEICMQQSFSNSVGFCKVKMSTLFIYNSSYTVSLLKFVLGFYPIYLNLENGTVFLLIHNCGLQ